MRMVQQQDIVMGEDRMSTTCVDRKSYDIISPCRHRHSSIISSCSEDAESESTSAGYISAHDEERDEELEYGPGIVSKLKTRYMSIALKQNRGTNMRRACSMENILDQDRSIKANGVGLTLTVTGIGNNVKKEAVIGHLKRAKSMDTLLLDLNHESPSVKELVNGEDKKGPKIIRKRDGGLNRTIPMICDEELPKPDTVKTYKRMFEPAESRRGSYCRRPPVLRASAKSCALAASKNNGVLSCPSAKTNGTSLKSKISAKQISVTKAQFNVTAVNGVNGIIRKPYAKDYSKSLINGGHIVKANPVKLVNGVHSSNNKDSEKEMNNINRFLNQKEVHFSPKTEIISNGNFNHKEDIKIQDQIVNGKHEVLGCENSKPKIPPNKPTLKPPRPLPKLQINKPSKDFSPKLKLSPINGLQKIPETEKVVESNFRVEPREKEEKPLSPETKLLPSKELKSPKESKPVVESKSPEMSKLKNGFGNVVSEKTASPIIRDAKPVVIPSPQKNATESVKDVSDSKMAKTKTLDTPVKKDSKPIKKLSPAAPAATSMVFDFRGKDVVPHVAVLPTPFGCKSTHPKKRSILIDGKESLNSNSVTTDEEDEEYVDYSVPPPCGVIFEGENVKIGRGSILITRNKDLKITFDDEVDSNTFVYPSETSLLEESDRSLSPASTKDITPNDQPPPTPPKSLKSNTVIGTSVPASGLSSYTPSVLRTMDNFEPGMFRPAPPVLPDNKEDEREKARPEEEEEENHVRKSEEEQDPEEAEMLKPADPDVISSWSLSAGTSDLLF